MNTENGLDTIMMITADFPRLTVSPCEWYASDVIPQMRRDLRQTYDIPAAVDCNVVEPNDLIFRRLSLPPEDVSAGCDGSPKIDSAAVDYGTGAVGLDDLIFRRTNLPPDEFSAGRNGDYIYMAQPMDWALSMQSTSDTFSDLPRDLDDAVYGWQPSLFAG